MGLTQSDFDRLNAIQSEDRVTAKDFDAAEFEVLPEGHYLTVVDDLGMDQYNGTTKEGQPYSCDRIIITLKVLEPAKFAGKLIRFNRINLFSKSEPEWAKNKRLAFLTATGLVKKGDAAAVAAFKWGSIWKPTPMKFVFELEHRMGEDKDGNKRLQTQGKGFNSGFKSALLWGTPGIDPAGTNPAAARTEPKSPATVTGQAHPKPQAQGQAQPAAATGSNKFDGL